MKVVYICHPVMGDQVGNMAKIRKIARDINMMNLDVVPFVPYYIDLACMDDNIPAERSRGMRNGMEILRRPGVVDELWVYGNTISSGMKAEIIECWKRNIPVVYSSHELYAQGEALRVNYQTTV